MTKLTPKQAEKLRRLMMLTSSDKDGEALAALRMAQKVLVEAKVNWAEVLSGVGGPVFTVKPQQWTWGDDLKTAQATAEMRARREQAERVAAAAKEAAEREARRREAEAAARWEFAPEVADMLSALLDAGLPPSIEDFVVSISKQFVARGRLTDKQLMALRRIHRRNVHA
jgi:hypothetical protein